MGYRVVLAAKVHLHQSTTYMMVCMQQNAIEEDSDLPEYHTPYNHNMSLDVSTMTPVYWLLKSTMSFSPSSFCWVAFVEIVLAVRNYLPGK